MGCAAVTRMTHSDPQSSRRSTLTRSGCRLLHGGRINWRCARPGRRADVKDNIVRRSKFDLHMCCCWQVFQRRDVRRTKRLKVLCPGIEVVYHDANMMEAEIV